MGSKRGKMLAGGIKESILPMGYISRTHSPCFSLPDLSALSQAEIISWNKIKMHKKLDFPYFIQS